MKVPADLLLGALADALAATSPDDVDPSLRKVLVAANDSCVRMTGTNRTVLCSVKVGDGEMEPATLGLLAATEVKAWTRLLGAAVKANPKALATLSWKQGKATLRVGRQTLAAELGQGVYPDWADLLNADVHGCATAGLAGASARILAESTAGLDAAWTLTFPSPGYPVVASCSQMRGTNRASWLYLLAQPAHA